MLVMIVLIFLVTELPSGIFTMIAAFGPSGDTLYQQVRRRLSVVDGADRRAHRPAGAHKLGRQLYSVLRHVGQVPRAVRAHVPPRVAVR